MLLFWLGKNFMLTLTTLALNIKVTQKSTQSLLDCSLPFRIELLQTYLHSVRLTQKLNSSHFLSAKNCTRLSMFHCAWIKWSWIIYYYYFFLRYSLDISTQLRRSLIMLCILWVVFWTRKEGLHNCSPRRCSTRMETCANTHAITCSRLRYYLESHYVFHILYSECFDSRAFELKFAIRFFKTFLLFFS